VQSVRRLSCDLLYMRLKVLVSAYAVSPVKGSEPGMGWGWVQALSRIHDLWVITEANRFKHEIENQLDNMPDLKSSLRFVFVDRKRFATLEKLFPMSYYLTYNMWQRSALRTASELNSVLCFDVVHQLNMIGFREPGYLWRLSAPFVWGPVGGTSNVPLRFGSVLGTRQFIGHLARGGLNNLQLRFMPRVTSALKRADGFVTATSDTRAAFLMVRGKNSRLINEQGPPVGIVGGTKEDRGTDRSELRISWSGVHISCKALSLLLHALGSVPTRLRWHLDIIGEGRMTPVWIQLANKLQIASKCTWHGWVSREESVRLIEHSDLLAFTSLKEGTPTVVLEALAMGVPVICLDHCGQADVVNEECGFKIPVDTCKGVIESLTNLICYLGHSPHEIERLSRGAKERVNRFSWERKAEEMSEIYREAIFNWNACHINRPVRSQQRAY
jgi:glycosyltransferase involved in cell wall biosynthesis